jgi:hypothetical protein
LRRYGSTAHVVEPNFDARAMNEIGFRKTGESMAWEEFEAKYERSAGQELTTKAEGDVQHEAEERMLTELREQLNQLEATLGDDRVLLIESEQGKDYPKMREKQRTVVVGTENRLRFERTIDPPLRVGIYVEKKS